MLQVAVSTLSNSIPSPSCSIVPAFFSDKIMDGYIKQLPPIPAAIQVSHANNIGSDVYLFVTNGYCNI